MCSVLKVSRSAYYQWLNKKMAPRQLKTIQLKSVVKNTYYEFDRRYGSVRIHKELQVRGYTICQQTVAKYMREMGLRSIISKTYKVCTTDSAHDYLVAENVLNRNFTTTESNQTWVSDITYIPTLEGWLFLTIVLDLYDRKVIGWSFSDTMQASKTTVKAFKMAKQNRKIGQDKQLIFHSDRGSQYACHEFKEELNKYPNLIQSMSRRGNCWDNAVAESFFKSLKSEETNHYNYQTIKEAEDAIFKYIECFYNKNRRHSTLGNLTIDEFWNRLGLVA